MLEQVIKDANEAVKSIVRVGIDSAMNMFNKRN